MKGGVFRVGRKQSEDTERAENAEAATSDQDGRGPVEGMGRGRESLPGFPQGHGGSTGTVGSDVFPNFGQVCEGIRMENKCAHERRRSWRSWRSWANACSPSIG